MSNAKIPPVPPASRRPAGGSKPGASNAAGGAATRDQRDADPASKHRKVDQQGHQGSTRQNARPQGR